MKKALTLTFVLLVTSATLFSQGKNVGIGTATPDASSILELKSGDQGFLVPRLTTAQRLAISNPADGLLLYDITVGCFFYFKNTQWASLCSGQGGVPGPTGPTGISGVNGFDGMAGPTGVQGPVGAIGNTGPAGSDGLNGPGYLATSITQLTIAGGSKTVTTQPGLAYLPNDRARIAATPSDYMEGVVTVYLGTTLTVNVDRIIGGGTFSNWNIGIAGDVGATGPQGGTGLAGAAGPMGPQGNTGANGKSCWDSNNNNINDPFEDVNGDGFFNTADCNGGVGIPGATGPQGIQGIQGSTGGIGPQGIQGVNGLAGTAGSMGPQGNTGANGKSCWDSNNNNINDPLEDVNGDGFFNTADCNGGVGIPGATGPQGLQGIQGVTGTQGLQGVPGVTGPQGIQGTQGSTGGTGPQGIQGVQGTQGIQG
ncbi:MAG: hypothetical protein V4615_16595, partial [Bacteroidota bacterium]